MPTRAFPTPDGCASAPDRKAASASATDFPSFPQLKPASRLQGRRRPRDDPRTALPTSPRQFQSRPGFDKFLRVSAYLETSDNPLISLAAATAFTGRSGSDAAGFGPDFRIPNARCGPVPASPARFGPQPLGGGLARSRSHRNRPMLYAMFAIVIAALARASPTVRIVSPIRAFWWAKTCSTFARSFDLRPLAFAVRAGIGRPRGFLRWMRLFSPFSFSHFSFSAERSPHTSRQVLRGRSSKPLAVVRGGVRSGGNPSASCDADVGSQRCPSPQICAALPQSDIKLIAANVFASEDAKVKPA